MHGSPDMTGPFSLELDDISVQVTDGPERLTILDGLCLSVAPGEAVGIVGQSGSGKSTMLAVAGLLRTPDTGRVRIGGSDTTALSRRARSALRNTSIGLVFQTSNLFPSLTAVEQLELVAHIGGRRDRLVHERARDLLGAVGLDHRLSHRPAQLSGGERQRVALARALMNEPAVLLADEPTSSLDPDRGREVIDLLVHETRDRGVAAVIVTHDADLLPASARTLRLAHGTLAAEAARVSV